MEIWSHGDQFIIFTLSQTSMGQNDPSCCFSPTQSHLDELLGLVEGDYCPQNRLSFDPFASQCSWPSRAQAHKTYKVEAYPELSEMECEGQETGSGQANQGIETQKPLLESVEVSSALQQKNQHNERKIMKNKKIKKQKASKKPRAAEIIDPEECLLNPEDLEAYQNSTDVMENGGIRGQNNCKTYHKLVKNYLTVKGLDHLFDEYEVEYHAKKYFVVSLIFIKYYLKQNFNEVYEQIVQKELQAQKKKISKRQAEKERVEKEIRLTKETALNYKDLILKRNDIEKKIAHIQEVMHEVEDYSMRSCKAYFQGKTEESLRILYLKDDPVMRKKYFFEPALESVIKIQQEVRKATSHTS